MTPELNLSIRQNACRRAHLFGAEAVILEKEAAKMLQRAAEAKRRYFRELSYIDKLAGHDSPFEVLA